MSRDLVRSTPFRIAVIYAALFSLSATSLLFFIYFAAANEFEEQVRERVLAESNALLRGRKGIGSLALVDPVARRAQGGHEGGLFYQLSDASGQRIAGNLPQRKFDVGWGRIELKEDPDDEEDDLVTVLLFGTRLSDGGLIVVGVSREPSEDLREIILEAAVWGLGLIGLLSLLGGLLMSRASLARVSKLSRSTEQITMGDLSQRLPTRGSDDELDQLSAHINTMLDRIEELMETTKQVSNDIAHDLRTPLSRMRHNLEGVRTGEQTIAAYQMTLDNALVETDRILGTFDALLRIGQIGASTATTRFESVSLSELVGRIAESYVPVAADKHQILRYQIAPNLQCRGDKELLAQLLVNLIENAIHHCPRESTIDVQLAEEDGRPAFIIADNGPGIPQHEHEKVYRPFYRLEQSRSTPGNGLGLALVKAIAKKHDIKIELEDRQPGLLVRLLLPKQV